MGLLDGFKKKSNIEKDYVLFKRGKYQEALELYDETLKIEPNNAEAWHGKGSF